MRPAPATNPETDHILMQTKRHPLLCDSLATVREIVVVPVANDLPVSCHCAFRRLKWPGARSAACWAEFIWPAGQIDGEQLAALPRVVRPCAVSIDRGRWCSGRLYPDPAGGQLRAPRPPLHSAGAPEERNRRRCLMGCFRGRLLASNAKPGRYLSRLNRPSRSSRHSALPLKSALIVEKTTCRKRGFIGRSPGRNLADCMSCRKLLTLPRPEDFFDESRSALTAQ